MKTVLRVFLTLIALIVLTGCAGTLYKNPAEMTPQERAYFVMRLYNNAYDNYNAQFSAARQPMSPEIADYFRAYKRIMEVSWPVISAYRAIVLSGGVPTKEQEMEMLRLIYLLQNMLIGR